MKLLIAQLQNQNPMQPMNSQGFMTELVNLQMVTEMQTMQTTLAQMASEQSLTRAASLIGKTVTAAQPGGGTLTGTVSAAVQGTGGVAVVVNGNQLPLTQIQSVDD